MASLRYSEPVSGAPVAVDFASGANYQVMKLDVGAPGLLQPVAADASGHLVVVCVPHDVTQSGGPWAVSGTVSVLPHDVGQAAGPWAVSGTVGVLPHAVFQTAGPWSVSGMVGVGNSPDVGQTRGPWAVSGSLNTTVLIPQPLAVSGTVTVLPHEVAQTAGPWAVSGSVSVANSPDVGQARGPWAVSGAVAAVGPVASGTVFSGGPVLVGGLFASGATGPVLAMPLVTDAAGRLQVGGNVGQTAGPWAVSGTLTANVPFPQPLAVSGRVTVDLAQPLAVSGTVTVLPHEVSQTAGPWAVSGTLTVGNSPSVGQTAGPWAVSGMVAAAQSGVWNVGQTAGPWATSGTVTANQGTSPWGVGGPAASGLLTTGNPVIVAGLFTSGAVGGLVSPLATDEAGRLSVNLRNTPNVGQTAGPWAVSGTVSVGNSPNVGQTAGPWAVSGTVNAVITGGSIRTDRTAFTDGSSLFSPVGGVYNDTLTADLTEDQAGIARMTSKRALHANLRDSNGTELGTPGVPLAVSGTVTVGNSPSVGQTAGPWAMSGTVIAVGAAASGASFSGAPVLVGGLFASGATGPVVAMPFVTDVAGRLQVGGNVGQTAGPWAVSGTVAVGSPHDVSQTAGPWAVSGTVAATQSGVWNMGQTAGPWAVSGTVAVGNSPNVGQTAGPWAVSGTVVTVGPVASGAAFSGGPVLVGGLFASGATGPVLAMPLVTDVAGRLQVGGNVGQTAGPWTVSGTVAASQSGPWNIGQTAGPWAVSGTLTVGNSPNVGQTAGPWAVSGTVAATQSGTWNTAQTAGPWSVSGTVSVGNSPNVGQTAGPWAVSGTVTASQGTSPWIVGGPVASGVLTTGNPVIVAGLFTSGAVGGLVSPLATDEAGRLSVNVRNSPNVGQTAGPWAVSGTVAANVPFPQPLAVSGRVVVDLALPIAVSGTVSLTANTNVGQTAGPWTVSGAVTVANSPNVGQTAGPWAVSGTVMAIGPVASGAAFSGGPVVVGGLFSSGAVGPVLAMPLVTDVAGRLQVGGNVAQTAGPWAVSGTVAATQSGLWNVGQTAGPWTVSGTVTVGNSPNVGQTAGPWAVSGTVSVGNSPNMGQTAGPWAVSGTVTTSPHAVFQTAGPWTVSGTVSALQSGTWNVGQTAGPWAVSGTVISVGAAASGTSFSGAPVLVGGLFSSGATGPVLAMPLVTDVAGRLQVGGNVGQTAGPWAVSGTVAASQSGLWNVGQTAGPWAVSGTVGATQSGAWNMGQTAGPWTVSGTVTAVGPVASGTAFSGGPVLVGGLFASGSTGPVLAMPLVTDVAGRLQVGGNVGQTAGPWAVSGTVAATQSGLWNAGQTAGPWAVSGTVSVGNSPNVGQTAGPWAVSGTVAATQSGVWNVGQTAGPWAVSGAVTAVITGGSVRTDNSAFVDSVNTFTPVGAVVNDLPASGALAEDFSGMLRMTPKRGLHVNLRDSSATEIGTPSVPLAVSGTVTVGNSPNVGQTAGPWAVSGTVSALQSGAWNVGQTAGPWAISGTVTTSLSIPQPLAVSGTVSIGNSPNVGQTAGPWAVSGTVSVGNSPNVGQTAGPWAVSGTLTVGNSPNVGQTAGPWAVSGTVLVGNSPNVGQTAGPWSVSGSVSALQSGAWSVGQTAGPWAVSGTVSPPSGGLTVYSVRNDTHNNLNLAEDGQRQPLQSDYEGSLLVVDRGLRRAIQALTLNLVKAADRGWTSLRAWTVAHGADPPVAGVGRYAIPPCNVHGVPFLIGGHPNVKSVRANYTSAQTNGVLISNAAGTKIVVTRVTVTLDKAATPNVAVVIGLAASTTPTTTNVVAAHPGIDPGGGMVTGDGSGILGMGYDGDQLLITSGVPTGGSLDVVVSYYLTPA